MPQRILGVDLGHWSVKAVLVETAFRSFNVAAAREIPLPPLQDLDTTSLRERQVEALRLLVADLRADVVVAGFPGDAAIVNFISLPFSDARKVDQTIGGEIEDLIPYERDDAIVSHEIISKDANGSLSLCVAAKRDRVADILETLQEADLDPRFLPVDSVELFNLYTHLLHDDTSRAETPLASESDTATLVAPGASEPPDARLIVDIGHQRTLVAAASDAGLAAVRVLRAGGRDVTEAIATTYGISFRHAEEGKHEDAFVASSRHPAATDAAQRMSDAVVRGIQPLLQELRRTLQSIRKERRVRIARIDLLGGGARIRNLANYLAEELNVPVAPGMAVEQMIERHVEPPRRGAYACALAFALRVGGDARVSRLQLRIGEFSYAGQLQHMRARLPFLAATMGALFVLLGVYAFVQHQLSSSRERAVDEQFCIVTKEVVGREICEPSIAMSVIKQPTSELGTFALPKKTATAVAAELSHLIRKDLEITVDEMEISTERARISGLTKSFDAVDEIVSVYSANPCFSEIKKGKLRKTSDGTGVEFQLQMKLGCSK